MLRCYLGEPVVERAPERRRTGLGEQRGEDLAATVGLLAGVDFVAGFLEGLGVKAERLDEVEARLVGRHEGHERLADSDRFFLRGERARVIAESLAAIADAAPGLREVVLEARVGGVVKGQAKGNCEARVERACSRRIVAFDELHVADLIVAYRHVASGVGGRGVVRREGQVDAERLRVVVERSRHVALAGEHVAEG